MARMLVTHIVFFRCHKQSLPEELSSCLITKPEVLRTKPDVVCKAALLSSQSSQIGTGDLKGLSEPSGSCSQPKTDADQENRLEFVPPALTDLPRECLTTKASSKAELEMAHTPELQKHPERAPSTSNVLASKLEVKAVVNSDSPKSCAEKQAEPSACRSQNSKESSTKVDGESCCTRSNNKFQNGEHF